MYRSSGPPKNGVSVFIVMAAVSAFILSESIAPNQKYVLDRSFRQRIRAGSNWKVKEIWDLIQADVVNVNFRKNNRYEIVSFQQEQYGNDRTSFRIGPAKLLQFREMCEDFEKGWKKRNESVPKYQFESPLHIPWLLADTKLAEDWQPNTIEKENFGKCAFEAEIGTDVESRRRFL
mgnify:CR=1 FL=1